MGNRYFSDSILQDILDNDEIDNSEVNGDYNSQDCGTTNPDSTSHILYRRKLKLSQDIASKLYYNSTNSRTNIQEYNLTKEYFWRIKIINVGRIKNRK